VALRSKAQSVPGVCSESATIRVCLEANVVRVGQRQFQYPPTSDRRQSHAETLFGFQQGVLTGKVSRRITIASKCCGPICALREAPELCLNTGTEMSYNYPANSWEAYMKAPTAFSRRDFLWSSGAVVVTFALGGILPHGSMAQTTTPAADPGKPLDPKLADSFLSIHTDGSVSLYTSKVDVGTGICIAMTQMVAEELGVPVERIEYISGDTALTPDQGGTGGSNGIPIGAIAVRQAAATLRQALLRLGAENLRVPASELTIVDGQVRPAGGGAGVGVGTLAGGKRLMLAVDPNAPLKDPSRYTVVGKPLLRPDLPGKFTAGPGYVQDLVVPGMLHGRVIRPPAIGATLLSVDESSLKGIPDVRVVRVKNFLGVVAKDEWAAVRAARALKTRWSEWTGLPEMRNLDSHVRESALDRDQVVVSKGDPAAALSAAAKRISATYTWPFQSHASLGPSCAVADVRVDGTTVWSSSQQQHSLRRYFAKLFGIPVDKLRLIYLDGSGSYGLNGGEDAAAEALLLSKEIGKPVRVQWMREEELGWDPKGQAQVLDLRGGIDAEGRILAWETEMWNPAPRPGHWPLLVAEAAGLMEEHGQLTNSTSQNAEPPYAAPHVRVLCHWLVGMPLRLSNLRAPSKIGNTLAVEGFTDELAALAEADPVEFRLQGLADPRSIAVIKRAAEMIGWQTRRSPNPQARQGTLLIGRGLAYARMKQTEAYVAMAMEVEVDRTSGRIGVRRVTCAHDCGLVVNPDGVRNQIEGSIVQTISRTLHEEVKFNRSCVTSVDWLSYPILRFPEAPAIEVALLDRPAEPPFGAGEPSTMPVAAAIANAFFDATGVRLRDAPFTLERVKASLNANRI